MPNLRVTPYLLTRPQNTLESGRWAVGQRKDGSALIEARSPTALIPDHTHRRTRKVTIIAIATVLGILGLVGIVVGVIRGTTPKVDHAVSSTSSASSIPPLSSAPSISPAPSVPPASSVPPAPSASPATSASLATSASPAPSMSPTPPMSSAPQVSFHSSQLISNALVDAFGSSSWIWLGAQALGNIPAGDLALRVSLPTFTTPATKAVILLTVDDRFTLYHNGLLVANSTDLQLGWRLAAAFQVTPDPGPNVFAIRASNLRAHAGVLASVQISYIDGTSAIIPSDSTWLVTQPVPDQFESLSFDDSDWLSATALVSYGLPPWFSDVTLAGLVIT